uniref:Uncharacterized protein n=1 Tax=Globodera rostochiensis TaxID=31243 RepID=A0A914HRC5_GLORO
MPRSAQIGLRPRIFGFERVNNPADDHSKCADIDKQKINSDQRNIDQRNGARIDQAICDEPCNARTLEKEKLARGREAWCEKRHYFASKHGTRNASEENFLDRAWKGGLLRTEKCHLGARL